MAKTVARTFGKQKQLLETYNQLNDEEKDRTILMGCDLDVLGNMKEPGLKKYEMIHYNHLFGYLSLKLAQERCYYELIKVNEHCKMYFDIDGIVNDHNQAKMAYLLENLHKDFYLFWQFLKSDNEGGCPVLRDNNTDKSNMPNTMNIYCSSSARKISYHIIFPEIIMANNFHCGAVLRRMELWILNHFGEDIEKNPYFFIEEDGNYEFVLDRAVYTTHRLMRILYCTKGGQQRFLRHDKRSIYDSASNTFNPVEFDQAVNDIFMGSFLQNIPLHNLRMDDDHDRSYDDHHSLGENSNMSCSSMMQLEWVEPSPIGKKVISMTPMRLRRLKMLRYLKKSEKEGNGVRNPFSATHDDYQFYSPQNKNSYSGFDSPDSSLADSGFNPIEYEKRRNRIHVVNENLIEFSNILMTQFKLVTAHSNTNLAVHYHKMMAAAESYLVERCFPDWWQNKKLISFTDLDPSRSVNIRSGVIHLYPKGVKRCEFKRFNEHGGNHVYFVVFTNKIYGNTGFYQKCHSMNHCKKLTTTIHPAYTEENKMVKAKFEFLQKKMKNYTKHCMLKQYPIVHFPNENNNLSCWIIVSIFLSVFQNFIKSMVSDYFGIYNQISNTEMIYGIIDRMINQIFYYLEFSKSFSNHKMIFQLVDQIVIESIVSLRFENESMADFYIEKYAIYRSYLIQFSLSNMYSTNNFNSLNEKDFLNIMKKYSSVFLPNDETISKRKNNSILFIYQMASITEKTIHEQYQHLISSPQEPEVVDEEKFIINKVIGMLRERVSNFLKNNYKFINVIPDPAIQEQTLGELADRL